MGQAAPVGWQPRKGDLVTVLGEAEVYRVDLLAMEIGTHRRMAHLSLARESWVKPLFIAPVGHLAPAPVDLEDLP